MPRPRWVRSWLYGAASGLICGLSRFNLPTGNIEVNSRTAETERSPANPNEIDFLAIANTSECLRTNTKDVAYFRAGQKDIRC